jgi:putative copper export protein
LLAAAGFALTGHTQGLTEPGFAPPAVALHVLIAGFWVAAPVTLWPVTSLADGRLLARLERFSVVAVAAIPILVALGVWLAWRLAGGFAPLIASTYGLLLLLKLLVALAAMGMGALNRQVVTGKVRQNAAVGRRWLRTTLAIETTLFLVAIMAVSAATTIGAPGE